MGLFDIFDDKKTSEGLGVCHGLDTREWNDGYKSDDNKLIKFVNNSLDEMPYADFLSMLKNRDGYRKFTDQKIDSKMSKLYISKSKETSIIPEVKYVYYPSIFLDPKHKENPCGYRIVESDVMFDGEKAISGKFKTLSIINIQNNQDYWSKKINSDKPVREIGCQFLDLDDDEYELIKDLEKNIIKENSIVDTWGKMHVAVYNGIFKTEKRKKYPINKFESYLIFQE